MCTTGRIYINKELIQIHKVRYLHVIMADTTNI